MTFGLVELGDLLCAGRVERNRVRLWARLSEPGPHRLEVFRDQIASRNLVGTCDVPSSSPAADKTVAFWFPQEPDEGALEPGQRYRVRVLRNGEPICVANFRTPPIDPPNHWTFAAFSCHQPFANDGSPYQEASSMLEATRYAFAKDNVQFALMMGDQIYADYPPSHSLFSSGYFSSVAPNGRSSLLECDRHEVRAIYQQRHRQFWGLEGFPAVQRSVACFPMLDDHEVVDNFGSNPEHAQRAWHAIRHGALDAFYDYQASRVLPRPPNLVRPETFDYGFTWGQAAFWMMDNRSMRATSETETRCFTDEQFSAFRSFLLDHRKYPLLVLMTSIPLVHVEGKLVRAASRLLAHGSDLHERWSHPLCVESRNRLLGALVGHAREYPQQTVLLLGGDVHSGAAFSIDFANGPRCFQLTSSAISNRESVLMSAVSELAARSVSQIETNGDLQGDVALLPGVDGTARNPFGDLNVGLVDVLDEDGGLGLRLRLMSHDGQGDPVTVFDSGELVALAR